MKTALIRMMLVGAFATSIPAFAMSGNAKAANDRNSDSTNVGTAVESNATPTLGAVLEKLDQLQGQIQQLQARDKENQREQQTNRENTKRKIDQQGKEWEHSLMGIYGG
jgi:TolA-binding protein